MTAPKLKVKKGDTVMVISGKNAGKKGKVLDVLPRENKVLVEGVNMVKRHNDLPRLCPRVALLIKKHLCMSPMLWLCATSVMLQFALEGKIRYRGQSEILQEVRKRLGLGKGY